MKKKLARWAIIVIIVFFAAALVGFFGVAPTYMDRTMNARMDANLAEPGEEARELHSRLVVADLHADPLLWSRDLLQRHDYGHMDLPRLIEGNVAVQVFSAVTKVPSGINYEKNPSDSDQITALVVAQQWPSDTWTSLLKRALYQSDKLHEFAERSEGRLRVLTSGAEVNAFLEARKGAPEMVGGVLAVEGAQCLEGELENVDELYDAGYRMVGLTHFFDNEVGGSAHGMEKGGLTEFGRQVIKRLEEKEMIIDLAHASPKVYDEVLTMTTRPVVVSHGGVNGTCPSPRNISDDMIERIAENGGVIGIGYWDEAICTPTPEGWANAVRHVVDLVGADHVGLGSDYDGATTMAFDTSQLDLLTAALIRENFAEDQIRKIMGGNVLRLLQENLPAE